MLVMIGFLSVRVFNAYYDPLANVVSNNSFLLFFASILLLLVAVVVGVVFVLQHAINKLCIEPNRELNEK